MIYNVNFVFKVNQKPKIPNIKMDFLSWINDRQKNVHKDNSNKISQ